MPDRSDLAAALRRRDVVLIVGAGLTVAATGARCASWRGLVEESLDYLEQAGVEEILRENIRSDLVLGDRAPGYLIGALTKVSDIAQGLPGGKRAWLESTIGQLRPSSDRLIGALASLAAPILTVNLDTMVEAATGRRAVVPADATELRDALQAHSDVVIHLHGTWDRPDSVVLSSYEYGSYANGNNRSFQLLKAIVQTRTVLFVGVGAGLSDPTFNAVFRSFDEMFGDLARQHYRLRTDAEPATSHPASVTQIVYGSSFDDLPSFLEELAHDAIGSSPAALEAPRRAFELICEDVRESFLLLDYVKDIDDRDPTELVVAPVILPMPPEAFAAARRKRDAPLPERFDAVAEARGPGVHLLVGGPQSGVTTALRWLTANNHKANVETAPVVLDYQDLDSSAGQIARAIVRKLREAGCAIERGAPLPPIALAIDGVHTRKPKKIKNLAVELAMGFDGPCFISCKPGDEEALLNLLSASGLAPELRYLGAFGKRDVEPLAELVAPGRGRELVRSAMDVVNREGLQRSPLTFCLLVAIVEAGESVAGVNSTTSLLKQFVDRMLGLGDERDDLRGGLDSENRGEVLANLAELFVKQKSGWIDESEVVGFIEGLLRDYAWPDSATSVLSDLIDRNVLMVRGQKVAFVQSSYLHIFAAQRARVDAAFAELLLSDVITFGAAVKHLAALERRSEEVLRAALRLIETSGSLGLGPGRLFDASRQVANIDTTALRGLLGGDEESSTPREPSVLEQDDLWYREERSPDPFPAIELASAPAYARLFLIGEVASSVLRDSDLVRNPSLKVDLLASVIGVWAQFAIALDMDKDFGETLGEAIEKALVESGPEFAERPELAALFADSWPIMTALSGMAYSLQSQKLGPSLDECFARDGFRSDAQAAVFGCLLAILNGGEEWARWLKPLAGNHARVPAVAIVYWLFAQPAWLGARLSAADESSLFEFLVAQRLLRTDLSGEAERRLQRGAVEGQLRKVRLQVSRRLSEAEEGSGAPSALGSDEAGDV